MPTPLTDEQYHMVHDALRTWLEIKYKYHPDEMNGMFTSPTSATQFCADFWHSALLYRILCQGKPPLPGPPPVRYSYPDYDAVEKKAE